MKAKVESKKIEIERIGKDRLLVNGEEFHVKATVRERGYYSLLIEGCPYEVRVKGKGDHFEVKTEDDELVVLFSGVSKKKKSPKPSSGVIVHIKSPMPGLVAAIPVKLKQKVKRGQVLVIVETMKMENEFASPIDGVVTEISAGIGDNIKAHQILLTVQSV